ncbi:MAG: beta-propeller fold lactonase family protein [Patescibacteria group bacterium]|jgi:YVTN family beta-propeller protein
MKNKKLLFWAILLGAFLMPGIIWARPNAYVVNRIDKTLSVIDTTTNTVIATNNSVNSLTMAFGIQVSPKRDKIYVPDLNGTNIVVIDGNTYEYLRSINVGTTVVGIVFNPAGTKAYAANYSSNYVSIIDVATDTVEGTITVGNGPAGIAIDPSGTHLYVSNFFSNSVSVIDLSNNSVTTLPTVISAPLGIVVLPTGDKFYVAQQIGTNPKIYVFNTADNSLISTISAVGSGGNIISDPLGKKVYVPGSFTNNVAVIDTLADTFTTINVGNYPWGISINPNGTKVFTININSDDVSVIDIATSQVSTITMGNSPVAFGNFIDPQSIVLLSSSSLSFDNTVIGKKSTKTLTIQNTGTANLELGNLLSRNGNYKVQNDGCSGQNLQLLGTCTADVVFEPLKTSGIKKTKITFTSNDPDQTTVDVNLTGRAIYANKFVTKHATSKQILIKKNTTRYADNFYFNFKKYPAKLKKSKRYLKISKVKKYPQNFVDARNKTLKKYWVLTNDIYKVNANYKFQATFKYSQKEFKRLKKKIAGLKKSNLTIKYRTQNDANWRDLNTNWTDIRIVPKDKKIIVKYFSTLKEKVYYFAISVK